MKNFGKRGYVSLLTVLSTLVVLHPMARLSASVDWVEARDYRHEVQSPWYSGIIGGSVYLETFMEGPILSQTFTTPHISSPAGLIGWASGFHSVDGDDGIIDEFGRFGGAYTGGATASPDDARVSFRFDFTPNDAGDLPRSVGLVVTNAIMNTFNPVGIRSVAAAFDASGTRIGEWVIDDLPLSIIQSSLEWRPYHTNGAQFVGVLSDIGIASFTIAGVGHVDHVQYSFDRIPEPGVSWLLAAAAGSLVLRRHRRRQSDLPTAVLRRPAAS